MVWQSILEILLLLQNNIGGYIIFGVTNSPRKLKGLSKKSLEQFNKIDEEKYQGLLMSILLHIWIGKWVP